MRVLVVEDEVPLARNIELGLRRALVEVDVEHDGESGLWRATEAPYDAIVLDIMLPGMNGYEICRTLRTRGIWTPILMLTAKDGELDEAEALDTGADDFLRKPFSFVVLEARLRALVRRGAPERPAVLRFGDLALDTVTSQLTRGDDDIALTRRELGTMELLMRAQGDPVPAQRILDHVWGFDAEPTSNVVQVTIRYLRRKIDDPYPTPVIDTVRSVGYRLLAR